MTSRRVSSAGRGRVAQAIDLVVDRRVLLDVRVARRDVRLGLVVVVVADEVLDPVVREELAHLLGELGGEALVGGEDQRRPLHLLDRPRDRVADLPEPVMPSSVWKRSPRVDALGELRDRCRLIAGRLEVGHDPEGLVAGGKIGHRTSLSANGRSVGEPSATPSAARTGPTSRARRGVEFLPWDPGASSPSRPSG